MSDSVQTVSKSAAALRKVIQNHKASEIAPPGEVIEIQVTLTPTEAAKVLWNNNILGAPVWDAEEKQYVGFFDMRDILSAHVAYYKDLQDETSSSEAASAHNHSDLMTKWFTGKGVTTKYLASRNPFVSCKPNDTLDEVCHILVDKHCHRIPVVGEEGRCISIISQSALVKFLVEKVESQDLLEESLEEANLKYIKDIIKAADTASASEVFKLLDSHRLSGIAVVDSEDGRLVGNTSARDIKMAIMDEGRTARMDMDILSYLAAVRQATPAKKERYPSAHISEHSTVGHAIRLLAKTGYHRVFVVDDKTCPVGVISVADVISFVVGFEG
jgi:CBS domain-containing protein